jgi:tetratricopeptide (TPR) repeat protein
MKFQTRAIVGGFAWLLVGLSAVAMPQERLLLEPTVSPKEAALLAEAAASTNLQAAIAMLQTKALPKASAALDFAIGNFQFQAEAFEAAAQSYRDAVEKLPTFRNARKNLGRVYLMMEQDAEAIRVYQALVEDGIADADSLLLLGHGLIRQEHYVSAENAYRQVLLMAPHNADAQQGLVNCLLQQERHREARSLLKTILSATPQRAELWALLANVNVALDASESAISALETAQRLGCCRPDMMGLLGDLYLAVGQPADAISHYEAALAAGWCDTSRLLRATESFVSVGDSAGAARMLKQLREQDADSEYEPDLLRLEAELSALQGDVEAAIAGYRELVVLTPLNGKAMLRLGDLLQQAGNPGAAELSYERAGRLTGLEAEAMVRRAQLAVGRKHFNDAVTLLEAAEALESKPHVARYLQQVRRLADR